MAHTSGTATDYRDLLDKLRQYLVAQGWTQVQWTLGASLTSKTTLTVQAPGSTGQQKPMISLDTDWRTTDNAYAWRVTGHETYNAALAFGTQVGTSPIHWFSLWPNAIDYHFYVNDRRFMVFAKIGVIYISMYAGFFLPYALPAEYPWPFYIGATSKDLAVYNVSNSRYRGFFDPGDGGASYRRRATLAWSTFNNSVDGNNLLDNPQNTKTQSVMWPWRNAGNRNDEGGEGLTRYLQNMKPNLSGQMPFVQAQILDPVERCMAGMLDGVFWTGGFNRVPEQITTIDGTNYRLFSNLYRSTPRHFVGIEEGAA